MAPTVDRFPLKETDTLPALLELNVLGRNPAEFVVISFVVSPRMPPPSAMDCATMPCAPAP
ncbi:hypothetical protein D3C87_1649580 [compost metagenome]